MPDLLPLFPLQAVVFPHEQMRLHIFEPRYRQLIAECESEGTTFGIPCYLQGGLAEIGTEMRLVQVFQRYDTGESDILVEGVGAFRLERFVKVVPGKLYSAGEVERLPEGQSERGIEAVRARLREHYETLREVLGLDPSEGLPDTPKLSFALGQEMGLRVEQKLHLLSMRDEAERQEYLLKHLEEVIPVLEAAEETRRRVRGNGHFHKFPELEL